MGVQHGFGMITLPDGTEKKGKFENNVYIEKVKDDTVKPKPLLETITEDKEEHMLISQKSPLADMDIKKE